MEEEPALKRARPGLSEDDVDALIEEVNRKGKLTIDLAELIKTSLQPLSRELRELRRQASSEEGGDFYFPTPMEESEDEEMSTVEDVRTGRGREEWSDEYEISEASEEGRRARDYGVQGWGRGPDAKYDKNRISLEREREIRRNPLEFVEFVYQNRTFKLKPVGTIEPVPKRIFAGRNGSLYYYKTRDEHSQELDMGNWTKIYLKDYQKKQCLTGRSERSVGLAGYIDVSGTCLDRQGRGGRSRITAARQSKTRPPPERRKRQQRAMQSRRPPQESLQKEQRPPVVPISDLSRESSESSGATRDERRGSSVIRSSSSSFSTRNHARPQRRHWKNNYSSYRQRNHRK